MNRAQADKLIKEGKWHSFYDVQYHDTYKGVPVRRDGNRLHIRANNGWISVYPVDSLEVSEEHR